MSNLQKSEFTVTRLHEDFIWLHDVIQENIEYAGFLIPPKPPTPDFKVTTEKLRKLREAKPESGRLTKEELSKIEQDLEAEYRAILKKTVAQHEVFLKKIATHSILKNDSNFQLFLEYSYDLNVKSNNSKEKRKGRGSVFSSFKKEDKKGLDSSRAKLMKSEDKIAHMRQTVAQTKCLNKVNEELIQHLQTTVTMERDRASKVEEEMKTELERMTTELADCKKTNDDNFKRLLKALSDNDKQKNVINQLKSDLHYEKKINENFKI